MELPIILFLILHIYLNKILLTTSFCGCLVWIIRPLIINLSLGIICNIHQFQLLFEELTLLLVILVFLNLHKFHTFKAESVKFPLLDIFDQLLFYFILVKVAGIFANVIEI